MHKLTRREESVQEYKHLNVQPCKASRLISIEGKGNGFLPTWSELGVGQDIYDGTTGDCHNPVGGRSDPQGCIFTTTSLGALPTQPTSLPAYQPAYLPVKIKFLLLVITASR